MRKKYFILSSLLVFVTACSQSQRSAEVQESIQVNQKAKSHIDWESSPHFPETLFARWLFEKVSSHEACGALSELSEENLALFENQINSPHYASLVADCKTQLLSKLEQYWEVESASLSRVFSQPLKTKVIYKNFSEGYSATSGNLNRKEIILTFDDGPHPALTQSILDSLKSFQAPAIFFHMGRNVRAYPQTVKKVAQAGHGIGSHSMNHICLAFTISCQNNATNRGRRYNFREATQEIVSAHRAIYDLLGWVDPFFRFPYGAGSPDLKKFIHQHRAGDFFWNIDSNDWKAQTTERLLQSTMNGVRRTQGGIVLFHDIHKRTALMLPSFLQALAREDYTVVLMKAQDEARVRKESPLAKAGY